MEELVVVAVIGVVSSLVGLLLLLLRLFDVLALGTAVSGIVALLATVETSPRLLPTILTPSESPFRSTLPSKQRFLPSSSIPSNLLLPLSLLMK